MIETFVIAGIILSLSFLVLRRTLGGAPSIYSPFFGTFMQPLFWNFKDEEWKTRRIPTLVIMALLSAGISFLFLLPWWVAIIAAVFSVVFWNGAPFLPEHRFAGEGWFIQCLKRYGVVALGWWVADKWWPRNLTVGKFIDGYTSAGECFAGFIYGWKLAGLLLITSIILL